ncbi:MAG: hypothetical protein IPP08_04540 [Chlorobiota bacterium]|nr:hypothetical protein [Chlorobiota bacterium]QQS67439.1 MAG: hypothetical protein IPP08_04540 [Chlorobiota bacterium]
MKFYFSVVLSVLIFSVILNSCKESTTEDVDSLKPTITILKPFANDTLKTTSDSINIKFTARDNAELHEIGFKITNAKGETVLSDEIHVDTSYFSYDKKFKLNGITTITSLNLECSASDHSNNVQTISTFFYVKP